MEKKAQKSFSDPESALKEDSNFQTVEKLVSESESSRSQLRSIHEMQKM